jgi:hypothetical protein
VVYVILDMACGETEFEIKPEKLSCSGWQYGVMAEVMKGKIPWLGVLRRCCLLYIYVKVFL